MPTLTSRVKHAWNAFMNKDPTTVKSWGDGPVSYVRPDRVHFTRGNERSIITSVYNRISLDCASISIKHVRLDENDRYKETIDSGLNNCLTLEANIDQIGRALVQDIVMSLLDEGCVAIVPVDTDDSPVDSRSFEVESLRVGKITKWMPDKVAIRLYNDRTGRFEEIKLKKRLVAIVENPFYAVFNEPNSTFQRLMRKLNLLDYVDEQTGAGKIDLIIQMPYAIKGEHRKKEAIDRTKNIEEQLSSSKYGIAYADATEKIIQLNRSVDNQLFNQIESLYAKVYSQLGLTEEILNGTASPDAMNNYMNRTIEPIMSTIVDEMKRKFLSKTARSQGQSIMYFREPFKLIPINGLADLLDKLTRNEILTSNEGRQLIGFRPSKDPNADVLRNKNISQSPEQMLPPVEEDVEDEEAMTEEEYMRHMAELDKLDNQLLDLENSLNE